MKSNGTFIVGYSGHAFVVCDIFFSRQQKIIGYFEREAKSFNPYNLDYFGSENSDDRLLKIKNSNYFIAIGDNHTRRKVTEKIINKLNKIPINAIHFNSSISPTATIGYGVMLGDGVIVNACSSIGNGVICNTQSVIEHECKIGDYSHIAPGAVLCGNINVGENVFIGARAVIKQGVRIGNNVIIGAGTVVIKDIEDNITVVGNPQKKI
jgi:sugar O-acyltransferase (sialic acid O-acetyltransferase NeuD family)